MCLMMAAEVSLGLVPSLECERLQGILEGIATPGLVSQHLLSPSSPSLAGEQVGLAELLPKSATALGISSPKNVE